MEKDGRKFWNQYAAEHDEIAYNFGKIDSDKNRYPLYEIRRDILLDITRELEPGKLLDAGCGIKINGIENSSNNSALSISTTA